MKIKWYMWLWLWAVKTKSITDFSTKKGTELQTTMYFKEAFGHMYVVETTFKTRPARGKASRRARRAK